MSNESSGFPSVDNLTPFEYALAGVEAPDAQHSPSLSVIQQMRRLASEVEETPITSAALRDLMRNGGIVSRSNDRRSIRRKRPTTAADAAASVSDEGGFVDITPIELSEDPLDHEFVLAADRSATDDSFAALAAGFGPVPELDEPTGEMQSISVESDVDVDAIVAAAEPTVATEPIAEDLGVESTNSAIPEESPEIPEPPIEPKPAELARLDQAIVQAQALLANDEADQEAEVGAAEATQADGPDTSTGVGAEADADDLVAEYDFAALADDDRPSSEEEPTAEHIAVGSTVDHLLDELTPETNGAFVPGGLSDEDLTILSSEPESGSFFVLADGTELPLATGVDPADTGGVQPQDELPSLFPGVPDDQDFLVSTDRDELFLASEAPIGSDDDEGDEGAVLVGAGSAAAAGILGQGAEVYHPPIEADPLAAFNGPAERERRRVGGAFWALAGTAAAAAVLVLGGLWWANSLRDRTETDSAAGPTTIGELTEDQAGTTGAESADAEDEVSAGSDVGELEVEADSTNGDFGDPDSPSRSSGTDTSVTTNADSQTPATTAANGSDTTVATTAGDPTTTVPETTTPTVPEETTTTEEVTTTEAPATTEAPPEPTVPTTAAPPTVAPLGFIGDSVNLGSFAGPGANGVRVDLFEDSNDDGRGDRLIESQTTSRNGRYAFNVPAGCYVVQFNSIPGFDVQSDLASQAVCVEPGEAKPRVDGVLIERQQISRPPDGCYVEDASNSRQGVEVYENSSDWADSYIFYANNGSIVYRTPREPHDVDGDSDTDYEWTGAAGGFRVRDVWSVAASRNGVVSAAISCFRE